MKKVIFILFLLATTCNSFGQAQERENEMKFNFGFNFGVHYANLTNKKELPNNAIESNNPGFRLGILADVKLSKILTVSPKAEVVFNESKISYSNTDGSRSDYQVMPSYLALMTHFVLKNERSSYSPYIFIGPNLKVPLQNEENYPYEFSSGTDFAIDLGVGVDRNLPYFRFAPELRYSFGLLNVSQHPTITSINFHTIAFVMNLKG